jgi:hypothetical protein
VPRLGQGAGADAPHAASQRRRDVGADGLSGLARGRLYTDVPLRSGDLFVFGGPSRLAYHGVTTVQSGTADPATGLRTGRLNITLRVTGLAG